MLLLFALLALAVSIAALYLLRLRRRRRPGIVETAGDLARVQRIDRPVNRNGRTLAIALAPLLLLVPSCTAQQRADLHSVCSTGQQVATGAKQAGDILLAGQPDWVARLDALGDTAGGIVGVLCDIDEWVTLASHGQQPDPTMVAAAKQRAAVYRKLRTPVILSRR